MDQEELDREEFRKKDKLGILKRECLELCGNDPLILSKEADEALLSGPPPGDEIALYTRLRDRLYKKREGRSRPVPETSPWLGNLFLLALFLVPWLFGCGAYLLIMVILEAASFAIFSGPLPRFIYYLPVVAAMGGGAKAEENPFRAAFSAGIGMCGLVYCLWMWFGD